MHYSPLSPGSDRVGAAARNPLLAVVGATIKERTGRIPSVLAVDVRGNPRDSAPKRRHQDEPNGGFPILEVHVALAFHVRD